GVLVKSQHFRLKLLFDELAKCFYRLLRFVDEILESDRDPLIGRYGTLEPVASLGSKFTPAHRVENEITWEKGSLHHRAYPCPWIAHDVDEFGAGKPLLQNIRVE